MEMDRQLDAVLFRWNKFAAGEEFRRGANKLLEFIRRKDASKMIVDTSGITAHQEADQEWLVNTWIPKIIDAGIEYNAQVHKDSVIAKMDMEGFQEQVDDSHPDYTSMVTDSVEEAREWIAEK